MKAAMSGNGSNQIFSEDFSLPSTKLDEAVKRFKEGAARANGTYKPTNETKEQRRLRMALAAEKSKVGRPIIIGRIKYQAHSEEQNQQNEEDK
jgi:hypothetical protein